MIRVDNIDNLFWDNGTWKFPNTYPRLVGGKYLENVTPVMTSPIMGWIILKGDYNYAEFRGELFFLKKDILISSSKNKWRYVLIKDHLCSILKNKANVVARGTLIQTDIGHLPERDIQFTFPAFNLFAKRILIPVTSQQYRWKDHLNPIPPSKRFDNWKTLNQQQFSEFIKSLQINKQTFGEKSFSELLQGNEYITLLGKTQATLKQDNWKNDLVKKIQAFLEEIKTNENIKAGLVSNVSRAKLVGRQCVTYINSGLCSTYHQRDVAEQILRMDLSGLTDIKSVSVTGGAKIVPKLLNSEVRWTYNPDLIGEDADVSNYVKKLARRVRIPFLNPYTTRAIYHTDAGGFSTWFWNWRDNDSFFYPQKVFLEVRNPLIAKPEYEKDFPGKRRNCSFRSVYLYWCYNFDFVYYFKTAHRSQNNPLPVFNATYGHVTKSGIDHSLEKDFIDPNKYFSDKNDIRRQLSTKLTYSSGEDIIGVKRRDYYESSYPWSREDWNLNIGWLIGQFSPHIAKNKTFLDKKHPFLITSSCKSLWRIRGFNEEHVQTLVQNVDAYEPKDSEGDALTYKPKNVFTLDLFNTLPARARQNTWEEDFLIGEKLLVTTWGPSVYLLFQPGTEWTSGDSTAVWYKYSRLDGPKSGGEDTLFSKYVYTNKDWTYPYAFFDTGGNYYLTPWGKQWFKKAYEDFKVLDYAGFYTNTREFPLLERHIQNNTQQYFEIEECHFQDTSIKSLNEGDVFFSDLEWFWFDDSQFPSEFITHNKDDWFIHAPDKSVVLEQGDIVVFSKPKSVQLHLGRVTVFEDEVVLPRDQYILEEGQVEASFSNNKKINVKYTKISPVLNGSYSDWDSLIRDCQNSAGKLFGELLDIRLTDLRNSEYGLVPNAEYLFDLVGTNFYCWLDQHDQVSLIWKDAESEKKDISTPQKVIYSATADEDIKNLTKVQQVNQRVDLSIFGNKLEMPCRAVGNVNIKIDIEKANLSLPTPDEIMDAYKVEVEHPLGRMYFRLDVPRDKTREVGVRNYFAIEGLNVYNHRAVEDYVMQRRRYAVEMDALRAEHMARRVEHKAFATRKWIEAIGGTLLGGLEMIRNWPGASFSTQLNFSDWTRGVFAKDSKWMREHTLPIEVQETAPVPPLPDWLKNRSEIDKYLVSKYGHKMFEVDDFTITKPKLWMLKQLVKPILPITSGGDLMLMGLRSFAETFHHNDRGVAMERSIAASLQQKALESYQIDLGFEREKENHLMNLKQQFAQYAFQATTSRERNRLLDELEQKKLGQSEIYLEVWTTSDEQARYIEDYHAKHGVDCRVPDQMLSIKNGIEPGIYCVEDVEISNLKDRIDHLFLKTRLQTGIKFVNWIEHERVEELIPVDPRITKLQQALKLAESAQIQLEQDKRIQSERISALIEEANKNKDLAHIKEADLLALKESVASLKKDVEARDKHIAKDAERYHELATHYSEQEKELKEARQIQTLYRGQTSSLKKTIEDTQHKLQSKEEENKALTLRIDQKIQEVEQIKKEKEQTVEELSRTKLEVSGKEKQIQAQQEQLTRKDAQIQQDQKTIQTTQAELTKVKKNNQTLVTNNKRFQQEIEQLKQQLQARPAVAEEPTNFADIWKSDFFRKVHTNQDYLVVSHNEDSFDIVEFDKTAFAWVKTDKIILKYWSNRVALRPFFVTPQYRDLSNKYEDQLQKTSGGSFKNVANKKDLVKYLQGERPGVNKYVWQTNVRISDELEGFPYFLTKPTQASDTLAGPVDGITNYGQYLDKLGMELKDGQVVTKKGEKINELLKRITALEKERDELTHENRENHASLTALHQLGIRKDQEIAELKEQVGFPADGFFNHLFKSCCSLEDLKLTVVIKKNFDYEIIEWNPKFFCFVQKRSKKDGQRYRVWSYNSYSVFTIAKENGKEKAEDMLQGVWSGYADGYFLTPQTTWEQLKTTRRVIQTEGTPRRGGQANAYKNPVLFVEGMYDVPYFSLWTTNRVLEEFDLPTTSGGTIRFSQKAMYPELQNKDGLYWNKKERKFTGEAEGNIKVDNYEQYIKLMGMYERVKNIASFDESEKEEEEGNPYKLTGLGIRDMK